MKTKLLTLFSLLPLLLVSTALLADVRPTGIRFTRAVGSGGSTTPTAEIDVSVSDTYGSWTPNDTVIMLGNAWSDYPTPSIFYHYASASRNVPLPPAIDWGDGNTVREAFLFGPSGGPWRGTFTHSYTVPGRYRITVGDLLFNPTANLTSAVTGNINTGPWTYYQIRITSGGGADLVQNYFGSETWLFSLTNTTVVSTGFGIPTLDVSGFVALSLLLVGTGILLYRKPQRTVA